MSTADDNTDDRTTDEHLHEEETASTPGSGKQFSKDVHSPSDESESRGSGKQFSKGSRDTDDEPEPSGSGKQFSPEHHQ